MWNLNGQGKTRHRTAGLRIYLIQHGSELCKYRWEQTGQCSAIILPKTAVIKGSDQLRQTKKCLLARYDGRNIDLYFFLLGMVTKIPQCLNKHILRKYNFRVSVLCPVKICVLLQRRTLGIHRKPHLLIIYQEIKGTCKSMRLDMDDLEG